MTRDNYCLSLSNDLNNVYKNDQITYNLKSKIILNISKNRTNQNKISENLTNKVFKSYVYYIYEKWSS